MKKGFTIVEVSILFVIFLIVAMLVAPLSLDDTRQARSTSRWRNVQQDFANINYSVNTLINEEESSYKEAFDETLSNEIQGTLKPYKMTFMNGTLPNTTYRFTDYNLTYSGAVVATKIFENAENSDLIGLILYDVNGKSGPNVWGKDVFGLNVYRDRFEPFCKEKSLNEQKEDCSKKGSGLCCSNYYLLGGSFE